MAKEKLFTIPRAYMIAFLIHRLDYFTSGYYVQDGKKMAVVPARKAIFTLGIF